MRVSKTGYKKNSKDKNNPSLLIPSNKITMKDVEFPVLGTDNYGNQQMMYPGLDYSFPGDYVYEKPMKNWLNKYADGGSPCPDGYMWDSKLQDCVKLYDDLGEYRKANRAYQDSSLLHKSGEDYYTRLKNLAFSVDNYNGHEVININEENLNRAREENYEKYPQVLPNPNYENGKNYQPSSKYGIYISDVGEISSNRYKKPTQPVKFKPVEEQTHMTGKKVTRIPTPERQVNMQPSNLVNLSDIPDRLLSWDQIKTKYAELGDIEPMYQMTNNREGVGNQKIVGIRYRKVNKDNPRISYPAEIRFKTGGAAKYANGGQTCDEGYEWDESLQRCVKVYNDYNEYEKASKQYELQKFLYDDYKKRETLYNDFNKKYNLKSWNDDKTYGYMYGMPLESVREYYRDNKGLPKELYQFTDDEDLKAVSINPTEWAQHSTYPDDLAQKYEDFLGISMPDYSPDEPWRGKNVYRINEPEPIKLSSSIPDSELPWEYIQKKYSDQYGAIDPFYEADQTHPKGQRLVGFTYREHDKDNPRISHPAQYRFPTKKKGGATKWLDQYDGGGPGPKMVTVVVDGKTKTIPITSPQYKKLYPNLMQNYIDPATGELSAVGTMMDPIVVEDKLPEWLRQQNQYKADYIAKDKERWKGWYKAFGYPQEKVEKRANKDARKKTGVYLDNLYREYVNEELKENTDYNKLEELSKKLDLDLTGTLSTKQLETILNSPASSEYYKDLIPSVTEHEEKKDRHDELVRDLMYNNKDLDWNQAERLAWEQMQERYIPPPGSATPVLGPIEYALGAYAFSPLVSAAAPYVTAGARLLFSPLNRALSAPLTVGSTVFPGVTAGGMLDAAGAALATQQLLDPESETRQSISRAYDNPNTENVLDAVSNVGLTGLDYLGLGIGKRINNTIDAFGNVRKYFGADDANVVDRLRRELAETGNIRSQKTLPMPYKNWIWKSIYPYGYDLNTKLLDLASTVMPIKNKTALSPEKIDAEYVQYVVNHLNSNSISNYPPLSKEDWIGTKGFRYFQNTGDYVRDRFANRFRDRTFEDALAKNIFKNRHSTWGMYLGKGQAEHPMYDISHLTTSRRKPIFTIKPEYLDQKMVKERLKEFSEPLTRKNDPTFTPGFPLTKNPDGSITVLDYDADMAGTMGGFNWNLKQLDNGIIEAYANDIWDVHPFENSRFPFLRKIEPGRALGIGKPLNLKIGFHYDPVTGEIVKNFKDGGSTKWLDQYDNGGNTDCPEGYVKIFTGQCVPDPNYRRNKAISHLTDPNYNPITEGVKDLQEKRRAEEKIKRDAEQAYLKNKPAVSPDLSKEKGYTQTVNKISNPGKIQRATQQQTEALKKADDASQWRTSDYLGYGFDMLTNPLGAMSHINRTGSLPLDWKDIDRNDLSLDPVANMYLQALPVAAAWGAGALTNAGTRAIQGLNNLAKYTGQGVSTLLNAPLTIGSTVFPLVTAGNALTAGFGARSAYMLGKDTETGYYGSDAPLEDKIWRGLDTGLGFVGTGLYSTLGQGLRYGYQGLNTGFNTLGRVTGVSPFISKGYQGLKTTGANVADYFKYGHNYKNIRNYVDNGFPEAVTTPTVTNYFNPATGRTEVYQYDLADRLIPRRPLADVKPKFGNLRRDVGMSYPEYLLGKYIPGAGRRLTTVRDRGMTIDPTTGHLFDSNTREWMNLTFGKPSPILEHPVDVLGKSYGTKIGEVADDGTLLFSGNSTPKQLTGFNNTLGASEGTGGLIGSGFGAGDQAGINAIESIRQQKLASWQTPEGRRRLQNMIDNTPGLQGQTPEMFIQRMKSMENSNVELVQFKTDLANVKQEIDAIHSNMNYLDRAFANKEVAAGDYFKMISSLDTDLMNLARQHDDLVNTISRPEIGFYYSQPNLEGAGAFVNSAMYPEGDLLNIAAHEVAGHSLSNIGGADIPTNLDKELGKLLLKHTDDDILPILTPQGKSNLFYDFTGFGSQAKNQSYFLTGSGGTERVPFLQEVKQDMLSKGMLSGDYAHVTPQMLEKHYAEYMATQGEKYPLRIYDMMQDNKSNFSLLSRVMNNLPSLTIPLIGAGAVGTGLYNSGDVPQNKYGGSTKRLARFDNGGPKPKSIYATQKMNDVVTIGYTTEPNTIYVYTNDTWNKLAGDDYNKFKTNNPTIISGAPQALGVNPVDARQKKQGRTVQPEKKVVANNTKVVTNNNTTDGSDSRFKRVTSITPTYVSKVTKPNLDFLQPNWLKNHIWDQDPTLTSSDITVEGKKKSKYFPFAQEALKNKPVATTEPKPEESRFFLDLAKKSWNVSPLISLASLGVDAFINREWIPESTPYIGGMSPSGAVDAFIERYIGRMESEDPEAISDANTDQDLKIQKTDEGKVKSRTEFGFHGNVDPKTGTWKIKDTGSSEPTDSLAKFSYTWDNDKGGRYIVSHKENEMESGAQSRFDNVHAVAHFLRDADILPDQKFTPREFITHGDKLPNQAYNSGKYISYSKNVVSDPDKYWMLKKAGSKPNEVYIKYKKLKDITDQDKKEWTVEMPTNGQHRFSDVDWDGAGKSTGYLSKSYWLPLKPDAKNIKSWKDAEHTRIPYKDKQAFSRFSGATVTYIFKDSMTGESISRDISGSINEIKKAGQDIIKKYGVKPENLEFVYHDTGSYSAKPAAYPGNIINHRQWSNYNSANKGYSGAALMVPSKQYGGIAKYQDGGSSSVPSDYDKIPQSWRDAYGWTPNVEEEYQMFKNDPTGPPNLSGTDDLNDYNTRGMWDSLDRPSNWQQALDLFKQQQGYEWTPEDDGYYHAWSQHPGTGEWLKPKHHSTAWMNYQDYPFDTKSFVAVNPEGFFGEETLQTYDRNKNGEVTPWMSTPYYKKGGVKTSAEGYYDYINGYKGVSLSTGGSSKKGWLEKYK